MVIRGKLFTDFSELFDQRNSIYEYLIIFTAGLDKRYFMAGTVRKNMGNYVSGFHERIRACGFGIINNACYMLSSKCKSLVCISVYSYLYNLYFFRLNLYYWLQNISINGEMCLFAGVLVNSLSDASLLAYYRRETRQIGNRVSMIELNNMQVQY